VHHSAELSIVLTLVVVLVLGAATRALSTRFKLPYSIAVLVLGIAAGVGLDLLPPEGPAHDVLGQLASGSSVTPELILFVFLPILVFESAWSLEVHALRKDVGAVLILAGPVLLLSTAAVAGLMVLLTAGSWGWSWTAALVFGALISATDPVAVVALLRELGAPKRLGVLVEGESLFNDGTSIVVFTLLLGMLTGHAHFDVGQTVLAFVKVAGGGLLVGLVIASLTSAWLARTFNQPLIEITLTLGMAYAAMSIAEGLLHVSGIIAVVTAGLWLAGPGRTHISPEVQHFLHRFWQTLAYVANTLIFFLVGLVVAVGAGETTWSDWGTVSLAFAGIVAIRVVLSVAAGPLISLVAEPVSVGQTLAMGWGGLRGAVSLALGLMVANHPDVDPDLQRQVLILTTAVVFGTIVVNGSTTGWLLRRLGFDRPPAGDRLAAAATRAAVLDRVEQSLSRIQQSPELQTVNWATVAEDLRRDREALDEEMAATRAELGDDPNGRRQGYWRQVLSIERAAYWNAFSSGTVGASAVQALDHAIDLQLDRIEGGHCTPPGARMADLPGVWGTLGRWSAKLRGTSRMQLDMLELRYDLHRAVGMAAAKVLDRLGTLDVDPDMKEEVAETYRQWQRKARERLEDLRTHLPELTRAVETRIARRVQLNFERETWSALALEGAVDPSTAIEARDAVEQRMKRLRASAEPVPLPETAELCRNAPMFAHLDDSAIARLADITAERVLAPGEVLFEQGDTGGSAYLIARGALAVHQERDGEELLLDVLGSGDVVGEMTPLTGEPRSATLVALTTVTVGEIETGAFHTLLDELPTLRWDIWHGVGRRRFDSHVRGLSAFEHLGRDRRNAWFDQAEDRHVEPGTTLEHEGLVFVVDGTVEGWAQHTGPALFQAGAGEVLSSKCGARLALLPPQP
jgi:NhaP-type Na+/H+ or K+/H+ antiporter/CRP-like cAMP-binding protein